MKALIERILTDESARYSGADAQAAVALSEKFAPWNGFSLLD
jgi:hypothetical protein